MLKKTIFLFVIFAFIIRGFFSNNFPLTVDELNIWNTFSEGQSFKEFWQHFIKYDTHQPLFYLFWYPLFKNFLGQFFLRLPSIIFFSFSIWIWNKLFPYAEEDNQIPWGLFLFSPFLLMYTSFFLPYSLLILASLFNYYALIKVEKDNSKKSFLFFFLSCLILIFTHYYGALQAVLVSSYLIYKYKNWKLKITFFLGTVSLFVALIYGSDFLNDLGAVHTYRKIPEIKTVLGAINLLNGGRYLSVLLIGLLIFKKKWEIVKTREFLFIVSVIVISYAKSLLISPSFEARYLLILIYPLYFLFKGIQVRFIMPVIVIVALISLYTLQGTFGASFVTKYEKVPRTTEPTGLFITPCPKFYFPEENYICKDYYQVYAVLISGAKNYIIHKDHLYHFKRMVHEAECERMEEPGLYSCRLKVK